MRSSMQSFRLAILIAWRYLRSKRRDRLIGFIGLLSLVGTALGVAVLIIVLSVMNGFDEHLKKRFLASIPHIWVTTPERKIEHWTREEKRLSPVLKNFRWAAVVDLEGLLVNSTHKKQAFVQIKGIDPAQFQQVAPGAVNFALEADAFQIGLGLQLAQRLKLAPGHSALYLGPGVSDNVVAMVPRFKRFQVQSVLNWPGQEEQPLAFCHLQDAQKILNYDDAISGVHIQLPDPLKAPMVAASLAEQLGTAYWILDWTQVLGDLFAAIQLEKTMMFIMLNLVVLVAAFNTLSMLVMMVHQKKHDIAILTTLGASEKLVMSIFIGQGLILGLAGTALGTALGLTVCAYLTTLLKCAEWAVGHSFLSGYLSAYYISELPVCTDTFDVLWTIALSLVLSGLATLYPAWRASLLKPVEGLRQHV